MKLFVRKVLSHNRINTEFDIIDNDEKRINVSVFKPVMTEYLIRIWYVDSKGIDFTLYKVDGDNLEEVNSERYYFSSGYFYKRRQRR